MSTKIINDNVACCTIPAVTSNYTPKGTYKPYAGFSKVYVTGPEKSETVIVCVFDIFGFYPQTLQGADIISSQLNATVVMPDLFEPESAFDHDKIPPRNDQDKADLQAFFGGIAYPPKNVDHLIKVAKQLKADGAKYVGSYGLCWGGKVTTLAGSVPSTPVDAVASIHPAMLSSADVGDLSVPFGLYPSKDEPIEEYNKIVEILAKKPFAAKNDHKVYSTMFHGFAGARANLDDPENNKQFADLYASLVTFFKKALA